MSELITINHNDNLADYDVEDVKAWLEENPDHGFARIVSAYLGRVAEAEEEKNGDEEDNFPF